ncbi:MAG: hypothetical protein KAR40_06225 [Candidatus Sabulitectum sp.]|nr:hypothetical protein [Candidatus Sabulitectum sp.]
MILKHEADTRSHIVKARLGVKLNIEPTVRRARFFEPDSQQWWRKGTMPKRDAQRQKCYNAEREFRKKIEQKTFANITEVAKYVRDFMETPWFQRRFPLFEQCVVRYQSRTLTCSAGPCCLEPMGQEVVKGRVNISKWGMGLSGLDGGEIIVLHEIAHAVLPYGHRHDRRWVRTFLEFVGNKMGQDIKKLLMEGFRKQGVTFNPIKKVNIPQERLDLLAASRPKRK